MIKNLDGHYEENLTFDTNILIAENIFSEKYMCAKFLKIPVVGSKWIYDSFTEKKFINLT